ncbi:MAG: MgtC/SapB family protein [Roseomonas sp.]|nr:MgtC/SapB family protein [Roseomonas sp.]MCA3328403.1 MgtC/SapB family protein [Roseomonas sp.]MCA3330863.1 MgtC/SapB family protein [Roseomonas sp.]MCA3333946.1 MgtC/SapB family protein [Roseomonas sp.]MCA3354541.1 MgtC/SapB family protein [Roseomonas sp.]
MGTEELIHRLAAALAIGLLVGAERHWRERQEAPGRRTAGVRTFALTGLFGGVMAVLATALGQPGGALLLGFGLAALLAAQLPFALREAEAENKVSATSLVAALGTYSLGALAVLGDVAVAGAAAVAMTAILAARESLHGLMARITWAELRSALVLLSMTLLVMPLVPDEPIAVLGGLNPAKIWRFAILLAAISYLGYLAVRLMGPERGLLFGGAAGGLVSSTAVTLANARAAASGGGGLALAAGALMAGAVSCLRTIGIVAFIAPAVAGFLLVPLGMVALGMALGGFTLARRAGADEAVVSTPENPFELSAVMKIALLLAAVALISKLAGEKLGPEAVMAVAAITGLADVDAVALSVPLLAPATISLEFAAQAVLAAVGVNICAKAAYAIALGGGRFGSAYAVLSLAAGAAGVLAVSLL